MTTYTHFGGVNPVTAALTNVINSLGIKNPHTNAPFTEAMVLGVAGGLGVNYELWAFREHKMMFVTLGFHRHYPSDLDAITTAAERLGLTIEIDETNVRKRAAQDLRNLLDSTLPGIMWLDRAQLPHHMLSPHLNGYFSHVVGLAGEGAAGTLLLDDMAAAPFNVAADTVASARARIGNDKHRLLRVTALPNNIDLVSAVRAGIRDMQASGSSTRAGGITVIERWARLMTNERNRKGWPNVFQNGEGLYEALGWVHGGVKLNGTAGGALRSMYADFLQEAAAILANDALNAVAAEYRALAAQWTAFADSAMPHAETRELLAAWFAAYAINDYDTMAALHFQIGALRDRFYAAPPIDDINALFQTMQEHLDGLYEAESAVCGALNAAMGEQPT